MVRLLGQSPARFLSRVRLEHLQGQQGRREDRTVRLWNIHQNKMIKMVVLDTPAHTVAFAPSGETIAVGLGLDLEDGSIRKDGGFVIIGFK